MREKYLNDLLNNKLNIETAEKECQVNITNYSMNLLKRIQLKKLTRNIK